MTKLFNNQTSETSKCNKLIEIALQLQESGKASIDKSINFIGEDCIGINLNNSAQWFWYALDWENDYIRFNQRYSTNTGKTTKGFRTGFNFLEKIEFYKF